MRGEAGRGRCTEELKIKSRPAAMAVPAETKTAVTNQRIGDRPQRQTNNPIIASTPNPATTATVEGRGSSTMLTNATGVLIAFEICECCNVTVVCRSIG